MTNLTGQKPYQKTGKIKKNETYLRKVREQRCCICEKYGEVQQSPTTAHHPIHDRFGTRKRPDSDAIPLCEGHHQGLWDKTKVAIHREPKKWREMYGPDWSYSLSSVQDTDM